MVYLYKGRAFTKFDVVFYIYFILPTLITWMIHVILLYAPTSYLISISLAPFTFHKAHFFII